MLAELSAPLKWSLSMQEILEPITVTVAQARELTGLSTSSIYRLFENKTAPKLTRRKLGGKTLIMMSELRELLEAMPEDA